MSNPKHTLDLDALERDGRPELLTISYKGRTFEIADPYLIDWERFAEIDWTDAKETLAALMSEDDLDAFLKFKPSENLMRKLSDKLTEHYTGTNPGEADGSSAS